MKSLLSRVAVMVIVAAVLVGLTAVPLSAATEEQEVLELLLDEIQQLKSRLAQLENNSATPASTATVAAANDGLPKSGIAYAINQLKTPQPMEAHDGALSGEVAPTPFEAPQDDSGMAAADDEMATEENDQRAPLYSQPMDLISDRDVGYGSQSTFLSWHGYINFEFDDGQGANSNFDNHEFYLATRARASEKLSFTAEFEFEHTPEKLILPIQAYADYKIKDALTFRFGQWYTPMGISRSYNLRGNKNRMIRQVALTHDIMFENWSDVGIGILGEFKNGLFYDIAVGNGQPGTLATGDSFFDAVDTLQDHTEDNNSNKALHSRFGYHSVDVGGGELALGFSYGTQKYDPEGVKEATWAGADIRYLHRNGFRLQAEYMDRSGDDNAVDLANGISADAEGWYFQVSKRFYPKNKKGVNFFEPVIQIDFIDLNTNDSLNKETTTTAIGLIYSPVEDYLVKFEYDFVSTDNGEGKNKLWAALVYEF